MKYIILCLLNFPIQVATACDCDTIPTVADSYQYSDLIFVGEVTSIEPFDLTEVESLYEISQIYTKQIIRFKINKMIKGKEDYEVEIITGLGGGDCGFDFKKGVSYLVYAHEGGLFTEKDDNRLETDICDRTKMYTKPDEEMEQLLKLKNK